MTKPWCSHCMKPVESLSANRNLEILVRCHGGERLFPFGVRLPDRLWGNDKLSRPRGTHYRKETSAMAKRWDYSLSNHKLSLVDECQRCFFFHSNPEYKIERPRGLFPSLPNGMDLALKAHVDARRPVLPAWLDGKVPGRLYGTGAEIAKWRMWQSAPKAIIHTAHATVSLIGAFDDVLLEEGVGFSPADWKTRGSAPKPDTAGYYQRQMDLYALILEQNRYPISGKGYVIVLWPEGEIDLSITQSGVWPAIPFGVEVLELEASPTRAVTLIERATALLAGPIPPPSPDCEYCAWADKREVVFLNQKQGAGAN